MHYKLEYLQVTLCRFFHDQPEIEENLRQITMHQCNFFHFLIQSDSLVSLAQDFLKVVHSNRIIKDSPGLAFGLISIHMGLEALSSFLLIIVIIDQYKEIKAMLIQNIN